VPSRLALFEWERFAANVFGGKGCLLALVGGSGGCLLEREQRNEQGVDLSSQTQIVF
jgi:hypothetical protein